MIAGTVVEEWVEVGCVGEEPEAGAEDGVRVERVAEADAWVEALVIRLIEIGHLRALKGEAVGGGERGTEDGHVAVAVVEGTGVVVADAVVDVEARGELPGVTGVEEEGIDEDLALGVADGDGGGGEAAGEEVGEWSDEAVGCVAGGVIRRAGCVDGGGDPRAVEGEGADGVALVELVELGLAELAAEAEGVFAADVRELVGEVAGDVVAAFGRCEADGIVAAADDFGLAGVERVADFDVGSVGVGSAGDKAERLDVVVVVVVGEDLVVVVDSGEELIGDRWREDAVVDDGDVLHVDGSDLVVGEELRADGSDLIALADEPVRGERIFGSDVVVELSEAVRAVAEFGVVGVEVVGDADGVLGERALAPERVEEILHHGDDGDVVLIKQGDGLRLPADGRLGGGAGFADDKARVLEGEEAEELVVNERTADGEAGVVVADLLLGGREGAGGAEELVAVEVVGGPVNGIGAGLEREVDSAAGIASGFRAGLCLRGELIHGVDGQEHAGDAGDAALIDGGEVEPEIVVVDAVELPVHLAGACAVE